MQVQNRLRERIDLSRFPLVALVTYVIALLAWIAIVKRWLPMPSAMGSGMGMQLSMSDPGAPEAMAIANGLSGLGLYLLMWGTMMIAMMFPSTVPLFRAYNGTLRGATRAKRMTRIGAFIGTYALVWALTGLVPLAVNAAVPIASIANGTNVPILGGSLLVLSAYQLSPYKNRCLDYCRSPLGFLTDYYRPGVRGAVGVSFRFSVFCVGCCWALFAFMIMVGTMNLVWMAAITVVLSLERLVSWGERLARAVGVGSGIAGVTLVAASGLAFVG